MPNPDGPIIIAYDGSVEANQAIEQASGIVGSGTKAVILTVWESGLMNAAIAPIPGGLGAPVPPPDIEQVRELDRSEEDHAEKIARQGAELARQHGLDAEAHVARDERSVASTILELADERDARAIVIGSRRHSAIASVLLGSTTEKVLHTTKRPLIVIRPSDGDGH
ncbi:MAG: universal stress protein [Solirubrobacterales bacterium]|nr:universal stress protein [Solirubrobacterales bacterium]